MQLITRIIKKYRSDGTQGLKESLSGRFNDPLLWTKMGFLSWYVAQYLKPLHRPILILSNPRSGSSWVGETLGRAANAMYLREPITQSYLNNGKNFIFKIDPDDPDKLYKHFADFSFRGYPCFPDAPYVVRYPAQWNLLKRKYRRLVIKEVNPLACEYFLKRYSPIVILLIRHPAAVALSHRKFGWWKQIGEEEGDKIAFRLRAALDSLKTYNDYVVIRYEELCAEPLEIFRNLFEFSGLEWDENIEKVIREKTSHGDKEKVYSTSRDSRSMIRAWEGQLSDMEINNLKKGYQAYDLPWYQAEEEW